MLPGEHAAELATGDEEGGVTEQIGTMNWWWGLLRIAAIRC